MVIGIKDLADKIGVDRKHAYGIMAWLVSLGWAREVHPKKTGGKGAPTKMFDVDDEIFRRVKR